MAKFELHIEADTYGEFKYAVLDVAHGIIEGEASVLLKPEKREKLPDKEEAAPVKPEKEKKAAVPEEKKAAVPGLERPPKLGTEKKKIDPDVVKAALKAGWTQAKIAKEYGVTPSAISQIVKKYGW